jgi:hypothetical protein
MTPKRKAVALFALGVGLGIAIWVPSPWLTGRTEPWDADSPIWTLSWFVVAAAGSAMGRLRGACLPLGYAMGQMLITVRSVFSGEFGALGWLFIAGYAVVAMVVTLILGCGVAWLRNRMAARNTESARDQ